MLVYCAISYLLLRYGIQIGRLQLVPTHQKLHDALRAQHHFWRATGLALLIAILVGIVLFAVLVYLGAIAFDSLRLTHDRVT